MHAITDSEVQIKNATEHKKLMMYQLNQLLLTERAAAAYLGLRNHNTLAVWRATKRYDLAYIKVGRLVRYRREDLDAFIEQRKVCRN